MLYTSYIYGDRYDRVTKDDRLRAVQAAEAVLRAAGVDAKRAEVDYARQWISLDNASGPGGGVDHGDMTGLAATWAAAQRAASIALTEGWQRRDGVSCTIAAHVI